MALSTVLLKWSVPDLIQSGLSGTLTITPTQQLTDTTDHELIPAVARSVVFSGGTGQLAGIVANDNANIAPAGTGYLITVVASNGQVIVPQFPTQILTANGATQWLDNLAVIGAPSTLLGSTAAGVSVYPSGDTSGVTDTAAITAAEALGRKLWLAAGTFWTTGLTKQTGTYWEGAGPGATVLKLAAGADTDVVQGQGFTSLTMTGANTWGSSGLADFGISGMTIDGNASAQSGTSYGVRVYGYNWTFRDLVVKNCLTDGVWTEWGAIPGPATEASDDNESTADNVRCAFNGRHGWSHLGPSDCRFTNVLVYENNQNVAASSIGLWALDDQISNLMATASGMNGTNASGFTGTFTVQAAQLGGATDLYAAAGTLKVTTSSGTATMTYTGKTATTFTGCTVTSGAGTFQTGNSVVSSTQRFTSNGLLTNGCHSWGNQHTWAAVFDAQVSDGASHWEGAQYGQILVRNSLNKSGGYVYDITNLCSSLGIQLGDNGSTLGVPLSAAITANGNDIRTRGYGFMHDVQAHTTLNWIAATQSNVDIETQTKQTGTFSTTITSGSNGVDLSTFTGGSPGTLNVASTQNIPNGPGTLTIATANGAQTATFTGTNGTNLYPRAAGTQFTGVVAANGTPGSSTMSTGGSVALANLGSVAIGGTADPGSRVRLQAASSTTALSTGASYNAGFGPQNYDGGTSVNAWTQRVNGTQQMNFSGSSKQLQFPNATSLKGYSDNFTTQTWLLTTSTGILTLAGLALTGSAGSSSSALAALGAAAAQAASVSYTPADPSGNATSTFAMMGLGATCVFTPAGSGKVRVTACGVIKNSTPTSMFLKGAFGTSTAPANGAASTGTKFGVGADNQLQVQGSSASSGIPFSVTQVLPLTPATAYWFDLAIASNTTGTTSVLNVVVTIDELVS